MEKEDTAEKKRTIECKHYYKGKDGEEVVHKHTVTIIQKEEGDELKSICSHNTECTDRYFAVERIRVECPYKPDQI